MHGLLFDPYLPTEIPAGVDMVDVQAQVDATGFAVPAGADAAEIDGLRQVVTEAADHGIDLKIVVVAPTPPVDAPLRDVANDVGAQHPGATVLVLGAPYAGSFSTTYDRATLEAAEDVAKTGNGPVQASQNFLSQLQTPIFPWTSFTVALVAVVAIAAGVTRLLQVRARREFDGGNTDVGAAEKASASRA